MRLPDYPGIRRAWSAITTYVLMLLRRRLVYLTGSRQADLKNWVQRKYALNRSSVQWLRYQWQNSRQSSGCWDRSSKSSQHDVRIVARRAMMLRPVQVQLEGMGT